MRNILWYSSPFYVNMIISWLILCSFMRFWLQPHDISCGENLIKECEEEAGIPRSISLK